VIKETLLSSAVFRTIMALLYRISFLCTYIQVFLWITGFYIGAYFNFFSVNPHDFSLGANLFIQKYHFFGDFVGRKPTKVNFCVTVRT